MRVYVLLLVLGATSFGIGVQAQPMSRSQTAAPVHAEADAKTVPFAQRRKEVRQARKELRNKRRILRLAKARLKRDRMIRKVKRLERQAMRRERRSRR